MFIFDMIFNSFLVIIVHSWGSWIWISIIMIWFFIILINCLIPDYLLTNALRIPIRVHLRLYQGDFLARHDLLFRLRWRSRSAVRALERSRFLSWFPVSSFLLLWFISEELSESFFFFQHVSCKTVMCRDRKRNNMIQKFLIRKFKL